MNSMSTTLSGAQPSQKFHLKTSPNNNSMVEAGLDQAIRRSNVKQFIKKGVGSGNQGATVQLEDNTELEEHLLTLKKSCSGLNRQIKTKQHQSNRFKDQTSFTLQKSKKIKQDRQKLEQKIAQLQRNLDRVNGKRQSALHSSKTYEHILQRMKKDDIYHQLYKNQLERKLKALQKTFDLTQTKHYNISEFQKQAEAGLKDAHDQLNQQSYSRKNNYNSVQQQTQIKIQRQNKLKQRQKQTQQIQQLAADDIQDADLMKLKRFLTVQIFVRELLKSKITKLKNYYEPYEQAFFQIKSNTNVRDASSLKAEFFNFQSAYNQKTVWVKHLQVQINEAEQQRKKLKQKLMEYKIQHMEDIGKLQENHKTGSSPHRKMLLQESLEHELVWQRIQSWIAIQAKKMKIQDQNNNNNEQCFKQIVKRLKNKQQQKKLQKVIQNAQNSQTN